MYELFYKYLILNHKVSLPGIGSFSVERIPAKMDFVSRSLFAPKEIIQFNKEQQVSEKNFYDFLEKQLNISEMEAITNFNDFAHQIKDKASQAGGINLPGLGLLRTDFDGSLYFVADENKLQPLKQIYLDNSTTTANANLVDVYDTGESTIITQEVEVSASEEKIVINKQEDYWWVYAIILALLGVGALLYYYI